jgi:thiol-disulfide isomerase/thioredoxin
MNDSLPETHKPDTPKGRNLWIMGALLALLLAGLVYGVFRALPIGDNGDDFSRFKVGTLATLNVMAEPPVQPTASFQDIDGKSTTLAAFKGKVILVNLWATWCAPCVTEMPTLADLQRDFVDTDFSVVAISVDKEDTRVEAVAKLKELSNDRLPFFHDPKMAIVFPLKARGFPTSILYDRQGNELARLSGEADWHSPQAHALVEAALAQN